MPFKRLSPILINMGHHPFENRLVRTSSELFILTILASKGEAHPYEIQQMLLKEIFKGRLASLQNFKKIIDWVKSALDQETPLDSNEMEEKIRTIFPQSLRAVGTKFVEELRDNSHLQQELQALLSEAENGFQLEEEHLRIWYSDTTIYQVMKELENEELDTVTRTEILHGRGRKVYTLTENGRRTAFETIMRFRDLFQATLPLY